MVKFIGHQTSTRFSGTLPRPFIVQKKILLGSGFFLKGFFHRPVSAIKIKIEIGL